MDAEQWAIPSLLLQPYVENAILHGIKPKDGPGRVVVKAKQNDRYLICIIEDDGIGREKARELKAKSVLAQHKSQGMKITEERLRTIGKVKGSKVEIIDLFDEEGKARGTQVVLQIPLKPYKPQTS